VVFPPKELITEDKKTKIPNPEHARMVSKEQLVLNYLLLSLSHEMLQSAACVTPAEVWTYIMSSFESQSRARVINVPMALSMTKKGDILVCKYVAKMKALTDEIASVGKSFDDEDLVSYILVVSVPSRPGTPTYKLQVKTSSRACNHTLPHALRLRISPPYQGGLRRCHVSYDSGPRLLTEVGSGAAMCPMTLYLTSRLRWAPVLPHIL
jgi:hypothetical protein